MELKNALSFKKAYATSLPPPAYYSNKLVKSIKVFTVFDLNQDIKAGDLLNECVVFSFGNDFGLYKNHQEACKHFNTTNYEPSNSVTIILKSSVANTHAQFRVEVLFDDCTKLSDTTSVFNIIPSVK
jgi:patatin-like phospholipase/acyl hydrolase